jgi:hypothetical protein
MAFITREDGERFVIPSYREVLSTKQKAMLKKDILTLSQNYGDYITLQQKTPTQYEVAFSPDTGYLLGETVWHHFKRPPDMIYCEAIAGTSEAIMVIVKAGSVYLDGSFPVESIPEELIIFLTQENNFEIYLYGDVPISQEPEEGKFCFEPSSLKSFTVLEESVFQSLPLLKQYRLQLVEPVLKAHGIGVFPIKQLAMVGVMIAIAWMGLSYLMKPKAEVVTVEVAPPENPYKIYNETLSSPAPDMQIKQVLAAIDALFTMPGWEAKAIDYVNDTITAAVFSGGSKTETLFEWANRNGAIVEIRKEGLFVIMKTAVQARPVPAEIYPLRSVIGSFIDRLSNVYPGNHIQITDLSKKGVYSQAEISIGFVGLSPAILSLVSDQFHALPIRLKNMTLTVTNGSLSGSIIVEVLGS